MEGVKEKEGRREKGMGEEGEREEQGGEVRGRVRVMEIERNIN